MPDVKPDPLPKALRVAIDGYVADVYTHQGYVIDENGPIEVEHVVCVRHGVMLRRFAVDEGADAHYFQMRCVGNQMHGMEAQWERFKREADATHVTFRLSKANKEDVAMPKNPKPEPPPELPDNIKQYIRQYTEQAESSLDDVCASATSMCFDNRLNALDYTEIEKLFRVRDQLTELRKSLRRY